MRRSAPRLKGKMWVCPVTKEIVTVEFAEDGTTIREVRVGDNAVKEAKWPAILEQHYPRGQATFQPVTMTSVGVHAKDAPRYREYLTKKLGYGVTVTDDGDPVAHSNPEKRRILKAVGFFDRDGYDTGGTPGQEHCR